MNIILKNLEKEKFPEITLFMLNYEIFSHRCIINLFYAYLKVYVIIIFYTFKGKLLN